MQVVLGKGSIEAVKLYHIAILFDQLGMPVSDGRGVLHNTFDIQVAHKIVPGFREVYEIVILP